MADGALFVATRVQTACLVALEPAVALPESPDGYAQDLLFPTEPEPAESPSAPTGLTEATHRLLRAAAESYARWFTVVRTCLRRDRVRQQLFREEHDLPKSARLPYEPQPLTAAEAATAQMAEALIRVLFGDIPADYARDKFQRALQTGDMRAFKIRLLFLKARDTLQGSPLHAPFLAGLEDGISYAESLAGCIPDPSPRRLSRAEQARKRLREEQEARQRSLQPELNLQWQQEESNTPAEQTTQDYSTIQDIEVSSSDKEASESAQESVCAPALTDEFKILKGSKYRIQRSKRYSNKNQSKSDLSNNKSENKSVTVQDPSVTVTVTVTQKPKRAAKKIVRKVRDYDTVDQIIEDIEQGKIVPYESEEEICADVRSGVLSASEAFMFTLALDQYIPEATEGIDPESALEMERDRVDEEDGEIEDRDELDEDENESGDEPVRERSAVGFSYNPRGFGGCGGHYSDAGTDWNTDDE